MQVDEIKKLITKGNINEALSKTMHLTKFLNIEFHKQSIILLSRYNQIKQAERTGTLRKGDSVEKNDIIDSLLQIVLDLDSLSDNPKKIEVNNTSLVKENQELRDMLEMIQIQDKKITTQKETPFSNTSQYRITSANHDKDLLFNIFDELGIGKPYLTETLLKLKNIREEKNSLVKHGNYDKAADLRELETKSERVIIFNLNEQIEKKKNKNKEKYFNYWINTKEFNILKMMINHPEITLKGYEENSQKEKDTKVFINHLRNGLTNLFFKDFGSFIILSSMILSSENEFYNLVIILFEQLKTEDSWVEDDPAYVESTRRQLISQLLTWIQNLSISDVDFKYLKN